MEKTACVLKILTAYPGQSLEYWVQLIVRNTANVHNTEIHFNWVEEKVSWEDTPGSGPECASHCVPAQEQLG